ncbi:MAG: PAS domain-containing protein [Planctomycetes bacterium]|nr:PAS domain-containing protein [Planctomycetota bacterium]
MNKKRHFIRALTLRLPAWFMFAGTAAATAWAGRATIEGRTVAAGVSVLVFAAVAVGARNRRRVLDLKDDLRTARGEREGDRTILDHVPGLLWQSDAKGDRLFVGASWEVLTGQPIVDALGTGWLQRVAESDRDHCLAAHRLAATGEQPYELEYRLLWANGTEHLVHDRVTPCFDRRGRFCGYVGLTIDIQAAPDADARAAMVEELLTLNQRINCQALDLITRYEELDDEHQHALYAEQIKSDYLAALADELNGPIDEIRNVLELFESPDLPSAHRVNLERIRKACETLSVSRDRSGGLGCPGDPEEEGAETGHFDLRRLVEHVMCRQEPIATKRGLVAASIVEDVVPSRVDGEPLRLRRLLMEMWATSFRLASRGRVTMRVSPEGEPGESMVHFAISLAGDDITEDQLQRAYYPAEPAKGEPIGLGLGPCKRVADLMGGRLGVQRDAKGMVRLWASVRLVELNPNWEGRRTHGRLTQESVTSSVGKVLDLSLGGMRVQCTRPPEGVIELKLADDDEEISLRARVMWTKRVGFGKHQAGLMFIDLDTAQNLQLSRLATRNSMRRVLDAA